MNYKWLILMVSIGIVCASCDEPCSWAQYLGNPGRTGYINCSGPDSPEILWEITMDGETRAPFIMEDTVVIPYETCTSGCSFGYVPTMKTTVAMIDLLTGTLLQEIAVEDWLVSACPVGQKKVLLESEKMLYDIDFASASVSSISEVYIPSTVLYFPLHYPVVLQGKIVVPTKGLIVCFSRSDYRRLWDLESSLGPLYPSDGDLLNIAVSEDVVYTILGGEEGERIWAVDSATGTFIWVSEPLNVLEIAVDGPMLLAGGDNRYSSDAKTGKVYSLDTKTGKVLWMFECEAVRSNIMVGPDAVYFTDDMTLYAVDKYTGKLEWKKERKNVWGLGTTYLIGTGNSIICSDIYNLTSFSAEDGTQLWNVHFQDSMKLFGKKTSPAVAEGIIIIEKSEQGNKVLAFASDPGIFVKQGGAFVSMGLKEKAGDSYRKAVNLYEKKGNLEKAEEIRKKISELGLPLETQPPTPSASPPSSVQPPPELPPLTKKSTIFIASIAAITALIIAMAYYFIKRKS